MIKTLRIKNLILDLSNEIDFEFWNIKPGWRLFNLGREHTHMTIISLCTCGWMLNLRTPSMAD